MEQHYCQRVFGTDPNHLKLTFEDDPAACGKPAHFLYEDDTWEPYDDGPHKWWLCAECYDFAEIFKRI